MNASGVSSSIDDRQPLDRVFQQFDFGALLVIGFVNILTFVRDDLTQDDFRNGGVAAENILHIPLFTPQARGRAVRFLIRVPDFYRP